MSGYAIIHEEDVDAAPDYFSYFAQTLPLMQLDPTLYCISAWNDLVPACPVAVSGREALHLLARISENYYKENYLSPIHCFTRTQTYILKT
jgi:hypothetical protein